MLFWVVLSFLVVSATAQRIAPGACPNIPTDETFHSVKFLGNWIETEKTPSIFDFVMRCLEVEYKQEKGGSLNVNLRGMSLGGLPISITGDGVIHDSNRNGVFNVRYVFGVPFQGTLMTVVDTDYTEYAVLYSCTNSIIPRVFHTEYIWILTREGVLSNPSRQNIYTKLDSLKINRNQMQLSDRLNCPAVNISTPAREEPQSKPVPLASYVKTPIVKPIVGSLSTGIAQPAVQPVATPAQPTVAASLLTSNSASAPISSSVRVAASVAEINSEVQPSVEGNTSDDKEFTINSHKLEEIK